MKVAITATGFGSTSEVDRHFGRCNCFAFYDTHSGGLEFLPNPFKEAEEGAGVAAAQWIANQGTHKIVTGELGLKAKPLLDRHKIQIIILDEKKRDIQDIINMLNHSKNYI